MTTREGSARREEMQAAALSLAVGIVLLALKYLAYFLTGSAAIFSDATESIANVAAAAVAFYAIRLAHSPADASHPYGHGKIEFLSGWFEASLVLLASLFIVVNTVENVWRGHQLDQGSIGLGLALIVASIAVNGATGAYLVRLGKRRGSMTLEADGKHLLTDVYSSLGVVTSLVLVRLTGLTWIDPLTAIVMAGWIATVGLKLLRRAAAGLMDEQDVEDERVISTLLAAHCGADGREPKVCGFYNLRHRHTGRYHWVDFHLRLPESTTVRRAHAVTSALEHEVVAALGEGNAIAHVEPCARDHCPTDGRCAIAISLVPPGTAIAPQPGVWVGLPRPHDQGP